MQDVTMADKLFLSLTANYLGLRIATSGASRPAKIEQIS
jgi:hypothetical protein